MLRNLCAAIAVAAALAFPAAAHAAGDPVMALTDVRGGMECTGYSVFSGQTVEPFGVRIIAVVGESATGIDGPRILFAVTTPNIQRTGIASGFSGSPIYCPDSSGVQRVIGAASTSVGEYGDQKALATPIEAMIGTPVTPSEGAEPKRWAAAARQHRALLRTARPMQIPLTVGGLSPRLLDGLTERAAKHGVAIRPAGAAAGHDLSAPLRPGSAMAVAQVTGDIWLGGVGTASYVDGPNVWAFGHQMSAAGRRALFMQTASVADVIVNPTMPLSNGASYKLAGPAADVGTLTSDGTNAVAGIVGAPPPSVPIKLNVRDLDTGRTYDANLRAADESKLASAPEFSNAALGAALAVLDGPTRVFGAAPTRSAGSLCVRIKLRERPAPLRFCNRYVGDSAGSSETSRPTTLVGGAASSDVSVAMLLIDTFDGKPLTVEDISMNMTVTRGPRMSYLRRVELPRRVRRGQTVRGTFVVEFVRGDRRRVPFRMKVPGDLRRGMQRLAFNGSSSDDSYGSLDIILSDDEDLLGLDEDATGLRSVKQIARLFRKFSRYDGVRLRSTGQRIYRDPNFRIGGRAGANVRVVGQKR